MEYNMQDIVETLKTQVVEITFNKLDGTERVMNCTLQENVVPVTTGKSRATDKNLVVFDVDKQGWRTIVADRITKVTA
jgi:hypothetical protein